MNLLREIRLLPVSVAQGTPFLDAAEALIAAETSAVAVVDAERRVVGVFTDDDLLRGLFPQYLEDLHHTAFLVEDAGPLQGSLEAAAAATVDTYVRRAATVEIDAGVAHVVERFLHTPWGAVPVVEGGRFVGMVDQLEFTQRLLERLQGARR
jgi:CBS domain-containing protein